MSHPKKKRPILTPGWVMYLRTSDEEVQAPERSQESQRRMIKQSLIEPSGLSILGEYIDNFTGKNPARKNYQRLLADARMGKCSHVGVAWADRFGRSDVEGLWAFDELNDLGIKVRIASFPSIDPSTPDGRMVVGMLFNVARYESDRNGQRTAQGMYTKLLSGGWPWMPPDGYVNREMKLNEAGITDEDRAKNARYKRWVEIDPEQSKVWRYAWNLLLADGEGGLGAIAEALHKRGYRMSTGRSFVEILPNGQQKRNVALISRAFHNWFYAGWIVIDNSMGVIPPKTLRGNWEPIVTTEEFEAGLAILARRNGDRVHRRRHFYLLQGLAYLQGEDGTQAKMYCGTPNANRNRGKVHYYTYGDFKLNLLCRRVDKQVAEHLGHIQVDAQWLPVIREKVREDINRYFGRASDDERSALEKSLKAINDEEARAARLYAAQQLTDEIWQQLWQEWQKRRASLKSAIDAVDQNCQFHITSLDTALTLIAKAAIVPVL